MTSSATRSKFAPAQNMKSNHTVFPNLTALEAIVTANALHRGILRNSRFNGILVEPIKQGKDSKSFHTGTGFVMGAKDRPFGGIITKEFHNEVANKKQELVYFVRTKDVSAVNIMHLFEHQFRGEDSTIQLINASTNRQILHVEELHDADAIILKVIGTTRSFNLTNRDGGAFEIDDTKLELTSRCGGKFESAGTRIWAPNSPAIGLLGRGDFGREPDFIADVCADDNLSVRRDVLLEVPRITVTAPRHLV